MENRDVIRTRLLKSISNIFDKSTGTLVWELIQAQSIESESLRVILEDGLNQRFAQTADFENLKKITKERGIDWKLATNATGNVLVKGNPFAEVFIGDMFSNLKVNYVSRENVKLDENGMGIVRVSCEIAGSVGNTEENTIIYFPKSLNGINSVTNEKTFTNGYNAETKEELLERYYKYMRTPSTSGNIYNYEQWAQSVIGVGQVKVKPLWNGAGTVKVVILNSNNEPADQDLINKVAEKINVEKPIGATVTTNTVTEFPINVEAKVTLQPNYTIESVNQLISKRFDEYFKDGSFDEGKVYYAKIGNIIFETEGIKNIDYSTLILNNEKSDIILIDDNEQTQLASVGNLNIVIGE